MHAVNKGPCSAPFATDLPYWKLSLIENKVNNKAVSCFKNIAHFFLFHFSSPYKKYYNLRLSQVKNQTPPKVNLHNPAGNTAGRNTLTSPGIDVVEDLVGSRTANSVRNQTNSRPQDDSLENISKMTQESLNELCKNIEVKDRNDYIKCMLIFAIKAEKFETANVDMTFHEMIPYFQDNHGQLKQFVHEDIAAGRSNQENTLLHEILKCKFLSGKAKGSAFEFILRDGHDMLRDYLGDRTLGELNQWGNRPTTFSVVKWGDSLKKLFESLPVEEQKEFFADSSIADRLNSFTGIVKP